MATFQEPINDNGFQDAGATIAEAAGVVSIPEFDKIAGNHPNGSGDVDFYELQLASDAGVNLELSGATTSLALFNSQGDILADTDDNIINFSGEAGETFFLKVGEELGEGELTTPAFEFYEIALNVNPPLPDGILDFFDKYVFGTENNDTLTGSSKDEILLGYGGNDVISGNSGNDTLNGGLGADTLYDGSGKDVFYYSKTSESKPGSGNRDSIGLNSGIDRIDLSAIDADINVSGDQAFDFIGTNKFTGGVGQVRYDAANNLIQVEIQGDNNTVVDMEIASHSNFSSLSASDFIL